MGRVITNGISLSFAREATPGVLPGSPQWFLTEPDSISAFGATITKVNRTPISRNRARRKGVVSDLNSTVDFQGDLTLSHLRYFIESFLFSRAVGADAYLASAATGTAFTVPALSVAQASRLIYNGAGAKTLLFARGFGTPANNGLKVLNAVVASGATAITVTGLTAETPAATVEATVSVCGIRAGAGDLTIDAAGNLNSTTLDFTTTGITPGQTIYIGGLDVTNQFFNTANVGFVRVATVAAHKLTLSKRDQAFALDDGTSTGSGGTPLSIDLLFGSFVRNVAVDHADYLETSIQFELQSPNLMPGGVIGYEYSIGNYANSMSLALPLTGKATLTFGFIGMDTRVPTSARATNAANAKVGNRTQAFSTSSDIARLRAQDVDETGLTTDFKSATMALANGITAEKVLGRLSARYLNPGDITVDMQNQMLFTNPDVIERVRCNRTVGLDFVLRNSDGGAAFDLPTGTLTGGNRSYPANQSVLLDDTFAAHQEDVYGFTLGVSFFPVLPATPCP